MIGIWWLILQLTTLRGVILEEAIPTSASRLGGSRTTTVKDVIEYICPDLQSSCLKLASSSQKSLDQLLKVDQQGVGVMGVPYNKQMKIVSGIHFNLIMLEISIVIHMKSRERLRLLCSSLYMK